MVPRRASSGTLLVALVAGLSACATAVGPTAPTAPAPVASAAPSSTPFLYVHPSPVLILEAIDGAADARARAAFVPAPATVRGCQVATGQILRLHLVAGEGKAHYTVDPATSLAPHARRCVLEALSTVDIEGISGDASPSARPSGFTAQIRLEW